MENENIKGHWIGIFYEQGEKTTLDFSEDVKAKKFYLKPFLGIYSRKQQLQYFKDLKNKIEISK